jgi:5-methylcytosine-specific restriction endonuclease McrA
MRASKTYKKRLKQQGGICYYCEEPLSIRASTRDHFLPRKDGHTLKNNTVFACGYCNHLKGCDSIDEFRKKIISRICRILQKVVEQQWKIDTNQRRQLKKYTVMLKKTGVIIANGYKPEIIF